MDDGPLDFVVVVGTAVAIVAALVGAVGALHGGTDYALSVNRWGMERWIPAAVSLVLAAVALVTWAEQRAFRMAALFWAIAAAGFARPGLREAHIHIRTEMVCLVLGSLLAIWAIVYRPDPAVKAALFGTFAAPLVLAAGVAAPGTWPAEIPVYATILLLAALSPWARWVNRRKP